MNVLSLFDGMSCGQVALERAGIKVDNYFASEIDKYAISITQKNYPDTVQLGDVTKWREWDLPGIDLVIGGSPCQGFSFAGKRLNFDDPRSKLFFEFHNILKAVKPKYFLLENVKMKKESMDVITNLLEVEPIKINSALVSAQNRERLYWTNIPGVEQPKDKGILLKDIVLDDEYTIGAAMRGRYDENGKVKQQIELRKDGKSNALTTVGKDTILVDRCYQVGMAKEIKGIDVVNWRKLTPLECERLQTLPDGYTEGVSNTQRYKMIGNGWTVDVIAHIFKNLKEENHGTK
jgi:site-specific DNA-cytosine methylase